MRAFTQDDNPYRIEYIYGEDNRIIIEIFLDSSDTSVTYYYRYNEKGQLEAKEIEDIAGQGDAFQYFYDEAGRLVEEKEFVPSYGFPLSVIVEYKYYSN
jgi:YD repeat-containing protein